MNKAIPENQGNKRRVRELLQQERDGKKQNRLQALYLIVAGVKSFSERAISSITSFEYLMTAWKEVIALYLSGKRIRNI